MLELLVLSQPLPQQITHKPTGTDRDVLLQRTLFDLQREQPALQRRLQIVRWLDAPPQEHWHGVLLANEVGKLV